MESVLFFFLMGCQFMNLVIWVYESVWLQLEVGIDKFYVQLVLFSLSLTSLWSFITLCG